MKIVHSKLAFLVIVVLVAGGVIGYLSLNKSSSQIEPISADNRNLSDWQLVDARSFTLSLPANWQFNRLQGLDSYVGEFVGDGMTLSFDYGSYSNSLEDEGGLEQVVTYEMIGGYRAKIVTPKVVGQGVTGVFFEEVRDSEALDGSGTARFVLSGKDLNALQQETALRIFRTLQFAGRL